MRDRYKKALVGSAAVALLGAGVGFSPAAHAEPTGTRGGCGENYNPTVPGGKAHWELTCDNGKITIEGTVTDTRSDSKCVKVKAQMPNGDWKRSKAACPKGDKEEYTWTARGSKINAWVYTYDV
ncbi:hypothetical protein [Streptomyces alboflavus]|uniref:hypothetical protein n=1 Tax=Streptomyces alboflavus TaxID=67267 RepID=UPI0004BF9216|nr:hypothetical protein [Streptomyces alboflavus]